MSRLVALLLGCAAAAGAAAHSASDAYLNLDTLPESSAAERVIHGQWDVALRDLDFALHLDDDGDGRVTWGEVRRHRNDIERYVYAQLKFSGAATRACAIRPLRQLIAEHADGAYVALFFDATCARGSGPVTLDYALFFAIDPSHRGIAVVRIGSDVATAVLSPQNAKIALTP